MSNQPGELTKFTFKDTGVSVWIRKVNPLLINELRREFPEPEPPEQEVDYGNGPVKEKNYSHPDYVKALEEYNQELLVKMQRLLIKRGVKVENYQEAVAELRQFWKDEFGCDLEEKDDLILYVTRIAAGTQEDLEDLINAITRRSQPSPEAVEEAKKSFRS